MAWYEYPPYVSAAERRRKGEQEIAKRRKKGLEVEPLKIEGRLIARSFWGKGWCDHLEGYSDYENRLPRGRTYVRNGSVLHLAVAHGRIEALVQGSSLYEVVVTVTPLARPRWERIVRECAGEIDSLVELLRGKMSDGVMRVVTDRDKGLFPAPKEIRMNCSCPDSAGMCKHLAAVLYGIGARLDAKPELLFTLRNVDHLELLDAGVKSTKRSARTDARELKSSELSSVFGIELEGVSEEAAPKKTKRARVPAPKRPAPKPRAMPPRKRGGAGRG